MLSGIIEGASIRTLVEKGVGLANKRNLIVSSVILVIGVGCGTQAFPNSDRVELLLADAALAVLVGIVLNLTLPRTIDSKQT